jgi:hypothetical protein
MHAHLSAVRVFENVRRPPRLLRLPFPALDVAVSQRQESWPSAGGTKGLLLDWPLASTGDAFDAAQPV